MRKILTTDRMEICSWEPEDWVPFRPIATHPEVMRYTATGQPWADEKIKGFVKRQITTEQKHGFCMWKLLKESSGELIGFCGLQPLPESTEGAIETGWWIARDHWRQGLATEAARAVVDYGFQQLQLPRIVAIAQHANGASIRIMEKLGMRFERDYVHKGIPVVYYALDAPDPG